MVEFIQLLLFIHTFHFTVQDLYIIVPNIHIASGALVLLIGLLQMLLAKKGKRHRLLGRIYFLLMVVIFITSLPPAVSKGNWFLVCVSFFALYLVSTGLRYARGKGNKECVIDKIITLCGLATAAGMGILAVVFLRIGAGGMVIVPMVFGAVLLLSAIQDFRYYFRKRASISFGNLDWYFLHLGRMIGSYIAAITAFLVNVQPIGEHWVHWIWPTVLGTVVIILFSRYYQKKFGLARP